MNLSIDYSSLTVNSLAKGIAFTEGKQTKVVIQFLNGSTPMELSGSPTGCVAITHAGSLIAGGATAGAWTKTGTGTSALYTVEVDCNTTGVAALFSSGAAFVTAVLTVDWNDGTDFSETRPTAITIYKANFTGTESDPSSLPDLKASEAEAEAGTDNTKWMTPLRTAEAIAALVTSGTPPQPQTALIDPVHGNDSSATIGGSPFATEQAAYNAAYAAEGNVLLKFPAGTFAIAPAADWPSRIEVAGAGIDFTTLNVYLANGAYGSTPGANGGDAPPVTITDAGNKSLLLSPSMGNGGIGATGLNESSVGADDNGAGGNGGTGATAIFYNCFLQGSICGGGSGGDPGYVTDPYTGSTGGNGGNAGPVTLINCTTPGITNNGGGLAGWAASDGGQAGLFAERSVINAYGGFSSLSEAGGGAFSGSNYIGS